MLHDKNHDKLNRDKLAAARVIKTKTIVRTFTLNYQLKSSKNVIYVWENNKIIYLKHIKQL